MKKLLLMLAIFCYLMPLTSLSASNPECDKSIRSFVANYETLQDWLDENCNQKSNCAWPERIAYALKESQTSLWNYYSINCDLTHGRLMDYYSKAVRRHNP
jgi:hypothetical protein